MISDTRRRRRSRRRAPLRPARPPEPVAWQEQRGRDRLRAGAGYAYLLCWFGLFVTGHHVAGAYVDLARRLTGGRSWGMAISGWLIFVVPVVALGVLALISDRESGKRWRLPLIGLAVAMVPVLLNLIPTGADFDLADLVSGAGGADFILGLRNGALAAVVPLVVVPFVAFNERLRDRLDGTTRRLVIGPPAVTFLVATLVAVVVLAQR
ncbi:hypothetical protein AB0F81_25160 [Actinoplanes sp. NPDC024001]|uniref:hypothetical protein n=1 Tax=Actinoplanes sp. NPDC024001 TaxID=3154598 RepID=UPI003406290F